MDEVGARDGYQPVARLDELPDGSLLGVTLANGDPVCLANAAGTIFAVRNVCTHQDFPMSDGTLLPGCVIECAWHGAKFDIATGAVIAQPATEPLAVYEVRIADGRVLVRPSLKPRSGSGSGG